MLDDYALAELAKQIMEQGYDSKTAWHFAALIGDTPVLEADKTVIVMDGKRVVARLRALKCFEVE